MNKIQAKEFRIQKYKNIQHFLCTEFQKNTEREVNQLTVDAIYKRAGKKFGMSWKSIKRIRYFNVQEMESKLQKEEVCCNV